VDDTVPHDLKITFHETIKGFSDFISTKQKPLFLFSHENKSMRALVEKFSTLGLLFYAESLSGAHDLSVIKTEKKLIELFEAEFFDCVVRIGHTPLTKIWRLLEKKPLPTFHFDSRNMSASSFGDVLPMNSTALSNSEDFFKALKHLLPWPVSDETTWKLQELLQKYPDSEMAHFKNINESIPEGSMVYIGNSLVIRFFELTQTKNFKVFGNRGVNGIDGQLASAIGLASGTKELVYCILGDVTTFYDLSSLREMPANLRLIIMNNRGGRIFDMLKLDKRIILEHEKDFKDICQGMKLTYSNELKTMDQVQVTELFPLKSESESFLKEWNK
jgi:2-succinyl-5-enolpyruvyl-6-hydroxy-3-cyclohexene-1-carboxylate synthase